MEIPHEQIVEYKDLLTDLYNKWRYTLLERTASLKQGEMEKLRDPSTQMVTQIGKQITIVAAVELRKIMVREARQTVEALKAMLDACEANELDEEWSEMALTHVTDLTVGRIITPDNG